MSKEIMMKNEVSYQTEMKRKVIKIHKKIMWEKKYCEVIKRVKAMLTSNREIIKNWILQKVLSDWTELNWISKNWNKTWELAAENGGEYQGYQNNRWEVAINLEMVIQHSDVTKTSGIEAIIKLKRNVQNVNGNDSLTFLKISKNKSPPLK